MKVESLLSSTQFYSIENSRTVFKHLIVGAGLAGCLLAWKLQERGEPFHLIGSRSMPSAFKVAAGIINPITGRWMTKSWNFEPLISEAEATYKAIEKALGIDIYDPIPEIRFFQDKEDLKRACRRSRNPRYKNLIGKFFKSRNASPYFKDKYGSFEINKAAYTNLPKLVTSLQEAFYMKGQFQDEYFQHHELERLDSHWNYRDLKLQSVTFCEGAALHNNPWFKNLPLIPIKGEVLLCQSPTLKLPRILYHHKKWLLPNSDGSFRIGASYDEQITEPTPTIIRKKELLSVAQSVLNRTYNVEVKAHQAGIRPSTVDSRPIVGNHPVEKGLYLLNGLGSKGATSGPLMAKILVDHMIEGIPISPEVDLRRFLANQIQ